MKVGVTDDQPAAGRRPYCPTRPGSMPLANAQRPRVSFSRGDGQPATAEAAGAVQCVDIMSLAPGARLGPYEVLTALGAGGMGEVYTARDIRLDRLVAVKVLSPALAASGAARERFEREARAISRLSHPHVCALHDVGREGDMSYLVMELLDGATLSALISEGPLPMPDVLRHGREIAEALAVAARAGIVHRDLKPGNVMVTRSGIKLLDFGLAKTFVSDGLSGTAAELTTAADLTGPGTWLGTAPYMAPEQCDGRPVDGRSDLFALGAVLYEMATGRRAFTGDTNAAIASSILRVEPPPPSALRPGVPEVFDRLVHDCLAKDPDRRWQSAHDVALQLAAIEAASPSPSARAAVPRPRWVALAWAGFVVAAAVAAAALALRIGRPGVATPRLELQISAPIGTALIYDVETIRFAVSPDGQQLAFIAAEPGAVRRVWMRPLAAIEAKPVAGTDGASVVFWSPDGRSIGFVSGETMKRLDLASGAALTICTVPSGIGIYATWSRRGQILFATIAGEAIYRVAAAGGEPTALVKPEQSRDEVRVAFPWYLPDGNRYLYLLRHRDFASVLMLGEPGSAPRRVMPIESNTQYVEPGTLVFAKGGALVAQSFDASTGALAGEPVAIAASIRFFLTTAAAQFSTSPNGSLVFQSQNDRSRLAWLNRSGLEVGTVGSPGTYLDVRLAPSGRTAMVSRTLPATGTYDIWSLDLDRGTETRVTLNDIATEIEGVVVPGNQAMFFAGTTRAGALRLMRRDLLTGRDAPVVTQGRQMQGVDDVSPDGKRLVYDERTAKGTFNLWTLSLTGPAVPAPIRESGFNETGFRFAPDGDHYTFVSDESGRNEVYVSRLSGGGKTMVSIGGGFDARWSRGGREIVYVAPDLRMMAVPVQTTPEVVLGKPTTLFATTVKRWVSYDVSPNGERFLVVIPEIIAGEQPLTAFINIATGVERGRAPGS